MIITIGGAPGSGKSTVGRMLATRLGVPFFSMGDIRRSYAREHGMTLTQLNELAISDPTSDYLVDEHQKELPKEVKTFVLDSRLGFKFLPQSFKVYVTVDRRAAAERIFTQRRDIEEWSSVEDGMRSLAARETGDRERYLKLYGADPADFSQYDLVLDSSKTNPLELMEEIMTFLQKKGGR
jgi:cytidylate kinase